MASKEELSAAGLSELGENAYFCREAVELRCNQIAERVKVLGSNIVHAGTNNSPKMAMDNLVRMAYLGRIMVAEFGAAANALVTQAEDIEACVGFAEHELEVNDRDLEKCDAIIKSAKRKAGIPIQPKLTGAKVEGIN